MGPRIFDGKSVGQKKGGPTNIWSKKFGSKIIFVGTKKFMVKKKFGLNQIGTIFLRIQIDLSLKKYWVQKVWSILGQ